MYKRTLTMLCIVATAAGARASESAGKLEDMLFLDLSVVTASQKTQSINEAAADIIVITDKDIKTRGYRDLKDIFNDLPGVDVSYDVQGEVRTLAVVHGISENNKIMVLLNGLKLNSPSGERFIFGNNIPLDNVKQVEFLYGPSSSIYGADAYAAVINILTKSADEINGTQVSAGYGSNATYFGSLVYGKRVNEDVSISIMSRNYGSDGQPYDKHFESIEKAVAKYPSGEDFKLPVSDKNFFTELKMKDYTMGINYSSLKETDAPSTIPDEYMYTGDHIWAQQTMNIYLNYVYKKDEYEILFKNSVYQYKLDTDTNFRIAQTVDALGNILTVKPEYKYAETNSRKAEIQLNYDFSETNSLIFGVSSEDVQGFPKTQNLKNGRFDTSNLVDDVQAFSLGINGVRSFENYGQFAQFTTKSVRNFIFTLGERFDYNTLYGDTLNPRLSAIWNPKENTRLKFIYGTSYIQPSLYYKYENWANPYAMHIPNTDLKPEKLVNYTLLFEQRITSKLESVFTIYRNDIKDLIRAVSIDPLTSTAVNPYLIVPVADSSVEINQNQGDEYTQGADLRFKSAYLGLDTFLYYSYVEGRDTTFNYDLNKISTHKVNFGATYAVWEKISVTPLVRWVSDIQSAPSNSEFAGDKFPGYTVVNLNVNARLMRNLELNVNIINLLNTEYYSFSPYSESVWITARAPQPLRSILASLSYKF